MSPYMGYLPLLSVPLDKGNAFSRLIARLAPNTQLAVGHNRGLFQSCSSWYCPYFVTVRRYEKQINRTQPRCSSFSPISDVTSHVKLVRVRPHPARFQATYNHPRSAIWPGDAVEPEMFFLRSSCLILLTCSVSISFLVACLSKVQFIFVVVTNACCVYFVYTYGAFIKYLKVLFSCVCCFLID